MKTKFKVLLGIFALIGLIIGTTKALTSSSHDPIKNPHYHDMIDCFSEHLIPPEATVTARWNDYSFMNPPEECQALTKSYVEYCKSIGGKEDNCSAEYAAVWIALNSQDGAKTQNPNINDSGASASALDHAIFADIQNPDNKYAISNNPFERGMIECFSKRIVMGGSWRTDDGLHSATQLSQTKACTADAQIYFNWCINNGGEQPFCGRAVLKAAQMIINSTPYNLRMHETPEEKAQIEQAISKTKKAAEAGDINAQTRLGLIYLESNGIRMPSPEEALPWFQKAAAGGSMDAQAKLGTYYMGYGMGVPHNPKIAEEWWRKAGDQGSSEAASYLGSLYENGDDGFPQNSEEAIKWYKKAADSGDERAKEQLEKLQSRLQKNPKFSSNIIFMDTKWGINQTSDEDPACMQEFDHDPSRYKFPSRHALDACLLNMVRGGTSWSDPDGCSIPLDHWCQDTHLGSITSEKCITAKKAAYEEMAAVCGGKK